MNKCAGVATIHNRKKTCKRKSGNHEVNRVK